MQINLLSPFVINTLCYLRCSLVTLIYSNCLASNWNISPWWLFSFQCTFYSLWDSIYIFIELVTEKYFFISGLAFHPLDGILQAVPHVIALFIVPTHFTTHLGLLFLEAIWTTNIHDCIHGKLWPWMGAGYHTIHHTTYRHNYGHYTIWMDWMLGTLCDPADDDWGKTKWWTLTLILEESDCVFFFFGWSCSWVAFILMFVVFCL